MGKKKKSFSNDISKDIIDLNDNQFETAQEFAEKLASKEEKARVCFFVSKKLLKDFKIWCAVKEINLSQGIEILFNHVNRKK
ncbi:hypothetical protein [Rickettsia endosymbiont of Cardiosporidium cionae]|uniref:hypothetical protein n=1 Tax=Rickettsia endosymbiont of Cardiosporidium cionae TaxID=2777155 RepID=UPI0018942AE8|nr:hypothetical protein [Rickettsia endosymbiont of Cardiosporidium cionae]KAF8818057.1 hypothetical protein IHI24_000905 [Rickettsia endosymbiont of Cardiosporidium cionae]